MAMLDPGFAIHVTALTWRGILSASATVRERSARRKYEKKRQRE
jgi:hypothetical protein